VGELDQAIRVRQMHIRDADRSNWGVVAEYEADELASDSNDEKRLYRMHKEQKARKCKATTAFKKKPRQEGATKQHWCRSEASSIQGNQAKLVLVTTVEVGAI